RGIMEILAKDAHISFRRVNQTIAVNAEEKELPEIIEVVYQTVRGSVSDQHGVPLAGATIIEKGTSNGVSTDFDGNFTIDVEQGATLVISYMGYLSQEIVVSDQTTINLQMVLDAALLEDVVVVGYGNQQKASVSSAIASVSSESFNQGIVSNPGQLLQGKVAGVNVSVVSGEPGASQDVIIRGIGSLRSGTTPLYVVDGFTLDNSGIGLANNPLNFINSNDIESIEVLKDASATAIYGARAANGVIVITTKKGTKGKTQMNLSVSTAISSLANKIDVYHANTFKRRVSEIGGKLTDGGAITNWQDVFTRDAISNNVNFSMGGGSDQFSYYGSIGVEDQEGILRNSDLKRYSGRINLSQSSLDNRFKVDLNLTATRTENNRPLTTTIVSDMLRSNPAFPAYTDGEPTPTLSGDQFNALIREDLYSDFAYNNRILANVSPSFEIVDGLTYRLNLGVDYSH